MERNVWHSKEFQQHSAGDEVRRQTEHHHHSLKAIAPAREDESPCTKQTFHQHIFDTVSSEWRMVAASTASHFLCYV